MQISARLIANRASLQLKLPPFIRLRWHFATTLSITASDELRSRISGWKGANWMEPCVHQDIATLGGVGGAKMNAQIAIRTITACDYLRKGIRRGGAASFAKIEQKVGPIIEDVRRRGDQAVLDYTAEFDGADSVPDSIEVTSVDIDRAYSMVDEGIVRAFRKAADNIRRFHERQVQQTSVCILDDGTMMGGR